MKITLAQLNYTIGDFGGNLTKIENAIKENADSDFVIFSELSLSGYYPWDLIYRDNFLKEQSDALNSILKLSEGIKSKIVLGLVTKNESIGKPFKNTLVVIDNGKVTFSYDKKLLPTYNIFDEARHFEAGNKLGIYEYKSQKIGFFICEDGWNDDELDYTNNPVGEVVSHGADILISINASPSNIGKQQQRNEIFGKIATKYNKPLIYVNQVGSNDEIVFDGGSFVYQNGVKTHQLPFFKETITTFNLGDVFNGVAPTPTKEEVIYQQISIGLKDYLSKLGMKKVVVGSSGGIDSAVTLAIAALELGSDNVIAITMPSAYSSEGSISDSVLLCNNLGVKLINHPIKEQVAISEQYFNQAFDVNMENVRITKENLQARIRGQILMSYSNYFGNMVLSTGNKSEISTGYCTLYGDMNGGLNLIGDLYKMEVYALARYINQTFGEVIPNDIITKAPSAELAPGQKDSDSLPEYPILDAILKKELEYEYLSQKEKEEVDYLISKVSSEVVVKVKNLLDRAEFKRKQAPPIIRVHPRAFGIGRRIPIVQKLNN